jgi:hypothetical protein
MNKNRVATSKMSRSEFKGKKKQLNLQNYIGNIGKRKLSNCAT